MSVAMSSGATGRDKLRPELEVNLCYCRTHPDEPGDEARRVRARRRCSNPQALKLIFHCKKNGRPAGLARQINMVFVAKPPGPRWNCTRNVRSDIFLFRSTSTK